MMKNFEDYQAAFELERTREFPEISAFEMRAGFSIDRARLEYAARTLACPVKKNPPCWQHGRVIYAACRQYLYGRQGDHLFLDIGTAKGFSALCMAFAASDAAKSARVTSLDVVDPNERVARNSVADLSGLKTVREYVDGWPEANAIDFVQSSGAAWLKAGDRRIHCAFVDGKHTFEAVSTEAKLLAGRQLSGDLVIFDDLQIQGVSDAIRNLAGTYDVERLSAKANRSYAVAVRR